MTKKEMKQLSVEGLVSEVSDLRKKLFELRLQVAGGQVKDHAQFKRLRAGIARSLTFIKQKESSADAKAMADTVNV